MIVAFLIFIAFWPGVAQCATTPRWALAAILSALALHHLKTYREMDGWALWFALLLLIYAGASVAWAPNRYDALHAFALLFIMALAFLYGARVRLLSIIEGAAIALTAMLPICIAQAYGWEGIEQSIAPAGLFFARTILAETTALILVACIAYGRWWFVPIGLMSLGLTCLSDGLTSLPRAALLAVGIGALTAIPFRFAWVLAFCAGLIAFGAVGSGLVHIRLDTISQRSMIWRDAIDHVTFWGNGIGSWSGSSIDTLRTRTTEVHNEFIQVAYELGVFGLILLMALIAIALRSWTRDTPILLALLVLATFSFPLHMPATAWFGALLLGFMVSGGSRADVGHLRYRS